MTNAETQLASYFAKYEPARAKLGKALRAKLRDRLQLTFPDQVFLDVSGIEVGEDFVEN